MIWTSGVSNKVYKDNEPNIKLLLTELILASTSARTFSDRKQDLMWVQNEPQPCSELCNTSLFFVDFHNISYWKTSSVYREGNMHPPTVSNVSPEGGHYSVMWCFEMPTCNDPPQDGLFPVLCKWTLLFNINTLDISRAQDSAMFTQINSASACYHTNTKEKNHILISTMRSGKSFVWNFEFPYHAKHCIYVRGP